MVKNTVIFVYRVWVVDGILSGVQRSRRYENADKDQLGFFLAHSNTVVLFLSDQAGMAAFRCILGSIYFRNVRGIIYAVVILKRRMEDCKGLKPLRLMP